MKGIEKFVERCQRSWPRRTLSFIVSPDIDNKTWHLEVEIDGWLCPGRFTEQDLTNTFGMIRTIEALLPNSIISVPPNESNTPQEGTNE